jgi:hypothetical protein
MCPTAISQERKLSIFRSCFSGQTEAYGTRDLRTGKVRQVKQPVTDRVLLEHLAGNRHFGLYLLVHSRTRALAFDFDTDDRWPVHELLRATRHYDLPAYAERSKSKGYHVWLFFPEQGVSAAKARRVAAHVLDEVGHPYVEVFPKHDRLTAQVRYGNFIFTPLLGSLVPEGRTVFLQPGDLTRPVDDPWRLLAGVIRIPEAQLDEIMEMNNLEADTSAADPETMPPLRRRTAGLPICAQRMLVKGVRADQRVSCFRLAVALKGTGLPEESALAVLRTWACHNRPADGRRIIQNREIEDQTRAAYRRPYRSYGCEEAAVRRFCDDACPVRSQLKFVPRSVVALSAPSAHSHSSLSNRSIAMSDAEPRRPARSFRAGKLSLAIWEHESTLDDRRITRHSISFQKRYFDAQENQWKDSSTLFANELPQLRLLLDKAYEYLILTARP